MEWWQELAVQSTAIALGALVGIPTGLYVARRLREKEITERRVQLYDSILANLKKNLSLLIQIEQGPEGLVDSRIIYYNLELDFWSTVAPEVSSLKNPGLETEINYAYYELHHIARKIDVLFESAFLSGNPAFDSNPVWAELKKKTIVHAKVREQDVSALVQKIEDAREKLVNDP